MSEATELRAPRTPFQRLVRELAEQAMSVTHHDASEYEAGYIHEVDSMERKFGPIIRAYLAARTRSQRRASGIDVPKGPEPEGPAVG